MTKAIINACQVLGIAVHDHVIIDKQRACQIQRPATDATHSN
jgi:DNA repair protein RadC